MTTRSFADYVMLRALDMPPVTLGLLRYSIPALIEYITDFMTLERFDMIWTGTPKGISPIVPGDHLRLEIDGLGALENDVVLDSTM